jgi:AcrR family transcriptional regulator
MSGHEAIASRERIMEEAARLFVDRGYNGISMRELAQATGISKAGLYYHFQDKEDLFLAILNENLDQMGAIIRRCRQAGGSAREQISAVMREIFASAPEQRSIIRLANQEMANLSQQARTAFARIYQDKFIGQLAAIFQEGMDRHELRPMGVQITTWVLLGMMYPFFYPSHSRESTGSDGIIETILTIFFDGVSA